MAYPFVQGLDYGPRKGTLGLEFHMSEGGDELVSYLARRAGETVTAWRTRVRGVSCHAAILSDRVVQMVDFDHASGNVNPNDRSTNKGYYGHDILVDVLGAGWVDPNAFSISAEIAGHASTGPTDRQVELAIAWGLDMIERYPSLRGAWGHADQTDTKACPGTTPNMKAIFAGVGGHGLWTPEDPMRTFIPEPDAQAGTITLKLDAPHWYLRVWDWTLSPKPITPSPAWIDRPAYGPVTLKPEQPGHPGARWFLVGSEAAFVLEKDVDFTPATRPANPTELADARAAGRESFRHDVEAIP